MQQLLIVVEHVLRHVELNLWQSASRGSDHLVGIDDAAHMEYYIIIGGIELMAMQIPIRRFIMNFDISDP